MKEQTKKDIKEWFQIIGMAVVGGVVVMHINGFLSPSASKEDKQVEPTEKVAQKADSIAAARDSVIMMNKARTR